MTHAENPNDDFWRDFNEDVEEGSTISTSGVNPLALFFENFGNAIRDARRGKDIPSPDEFGDLDKEF